MSFKNALIVEDDNRFRALLKRLLEKKMHMIVFEAENGLRGLEMFKKNEYNIIFLDISMPHMDGIQLLEKIRVENKIVPVVIMTCHCEKENVQKIIDLGVSDYLVKTEFAMQFTKRIEEIVSKIIKN